MNKVITDLRTKVDDFGKKNIAGLAEADVKYSAKLDEINNLKKGILNDDGTLKDSAGTYIEKLMKGKNEQGLERLENAFP
jgi:hypothetical protein